MGETSHKIQKRIYKHKRGLKKKGNVNHLMIQHVFKTNRNFNLRDSKMFLNVHKKHFEYYELEHYFWLQYY